MAQTEAPEVKVEVSLVDVMAEVMAEEVATEVWMVACEAMGTAVEAAAVLV